MSVTLVPPLTRSEAEQRFLLPGTYDWEAFQALDRLLSENSRVRITYLDGSIELMTVGEPHELIKKSLAMLLEAYFVAIGLEFMPVGNATRQGEEEKTSFEPDESYYLGDAEQNAQKDHPDLAIEVIFTSGNIQKLEKYRRFNIPEVWIWENNQLTVYHLESDQDSNRYVAQARSILLPDLDLDRLVRCAQMSSRLEAVRTFLA